MTIEEMIARIDVIADTQRAKLVGDPVRAFEYMEAERGAAEFKAAGYQGDVPPVVSAWSEARGWSNQAAADDILREALLYRFALESIRAIRLKAKYALMAAATEEAAQAIFEPAITELKSIG